VSILPEQPQNQTAGRRRLENGENEMNSTLDEVHLIHIGKAGGSSVACNIQAARKRTPSCHQLPLEAKEESMLSRRITKRFHLTRPSTNAKAYVVTARHPVHRIISWFFYEHTHNYRYTIRATSNNRRSIPMNCGQIMLFHCYHDLEKLASIGLAAPRPSRAILTHPKVATNLTAHQCKTWAWAAVQGFAAATQHNFWNYRRYLSPLLTKKLPPTFYVIRNEHLWHDFTTIDRMLGGTGQLPKYGNYSLNSFESGNKLPVSNRTLSSLGLLNLCIALCDEIQIYKSLLSIAQNLNETDKMQSLLELQRTCPLETSLRPRKCSYD